MNSLFITRKSQGIKIMKKVGESQSHKRTNKAIGDTATSVKKSKHSEENEIEKFIKKNNDLEFRLKVAEERASEAKKNEDEMKKKFHDAVQRSRDANEKLKLVEKERDAARANEKNLKQELEIAMQDNKEDLRGELRVALKCRDAAVQEKMEMALALEAMQKELKKVNEEKKMKMKMVESCAMRCDLIREIGQNDDGAYPK
ncbi:hypothetical protein ACHAWO_004973 [Cyclotella atomus]|uniref:Uncharacterized protein n=1 Tax=Cyclotella atomus TaxID=382360 RepID=A0ABD3PTI2_9STRA